MIGQDEYEAFKVLVRRLSPNVTDEWIDQLWGPRIVMVFGANCQGIHGAGAAKYAAEKYGAQKGVIGFCNRSYGLCTKETPWKTMPLEAVTVFIQKFLEFAQEWPWFTFKVTRVGCGLAGFTDDQIAPLFQGAPENCEFDPAWATYGLKPWTEAP